jgi:hypothetical protein
VRISDTAYYDALAVSRQLENQLGDVAVAEVHLFAYLACLLALYKGHSPSVWGYAFAVTDYGYPFSGEIQNAIDIHLKTRCLLRSTTSGPEYLNVSPEGVREFEVLETLAEEPSFLEHVQVCWLCQSDPFAPLSLEERRLALHALSVIKGYCSQNRRLLI